MVGLHSLLLAAAVGSTSNVQLLHFTASWCEPCRQMAPVVEQLRASGYPVVTVDIDRSRELAFRFGVHSVPCFILLQDDQVVQRLTGMQPRDRLVQLLDSVQPPKAERTPNRPHIASNPHRDPRWQGRSREQGARSGERGAWSKERGASSRTPHVSVAVSATAANRGNATASQATDRVLTSQQDVERRAIQATVRLKIEDPRGQSYGTGTIVDVHEDEALVLTCAHLLRDSRGQGRILVDLFAPGAQAPVVGQLVQYHLDRDIALVSIRPGIPVTPMPIAGPNAQVFQGDHVFSVGCDHGSQPTVMRGRVSAINRYLGPPNLVVTGQPVDGRSGGGLFDRDGQLIGVCNCADPAADEGLYAALDVIYQELDRANLSFIYRRPRHQPDARAVVGTEAKPQTPADADVGSVAADRAAGQPERHDPVPDGSSPPQLASPLDAEIVCIVRPRNNPLAKSQVIVLDQPSAQFLRQLSLEQRSATLLEAATRKDEGGRMKDEG